MRDFFSGALPEAYFSTEAKLGPEKKKRKEKQGKEKKRKEKKRKEQ